MHSGEKTGLFIVQAISRSTSFQAGGNQQEGEMTTLPGGSGAAEVVYSLQAAVVSCCDYNIERNATNKS